MTNLQSRWAKPATPGIGERFNDTIRPQGALKPRIHIAITNLQQQISKLDGMLSKMKERDTALFGRIVEVTQSNDVGSAKILSNELAEVRKVTKVLGNARMALEQIKMRLNTASDLGDTVSTIMPTIDIMRNLKVRLGRFMPGADQEITEMAKLLGGIMTDTFTNQSTFGPEDIGSEESENILKEAAAVAETSVDSKFPMPTDAGAHTSDAGDTRYM